MRPSEARSVPPRSAPQVAFGQGRCIWSRDRTAGGSGTVTLVVFVGLAAAAVPLARGRLMNLAQVRFRRPWLLFVAMALQAFLVLVTGPRNPLRDAAYIASYFFAGAFLWENRRIPGLWLIGAGAALNLLAITMNGGV